MPPRTKNRMAETWSREFDAEFAREVKRMKLDTSDIGFIVSSAGQEATRRARETTNSRLGYTERSVKQHGYKKYPNGRKK